MKKKSSTLARAILETADGMHRAGVMDDVAHERIRLRHLGKAISAANHPPAHTRPAESDAICLVIRTTKDIVRSS